MLEEFVVAHRDELIARCRAKVAKRTSPPPTPTEIDHGVPAFLDQLTEELRRGVTQSHSIANSAAAHGYDMLLQGLSASQVVHGYGDVCQSITEMAIEQSAPINTDEFRMLNRCLDDAIASAITEYGRQRDLSQASPSTAKSDRIRVLGDGLRSSVLAGRAAFEAIRSGKVGLSGSTGTVLERSLQGIEDLNERLQSEITSLTTK